MAEGLNDLSVPDEVYYTHDNGGRPFKVVIYNNERALCVYQCKLVPDQGARVNYLTQRTDERDTQITEYTSRPSMTATYTKLVFQTTFSRVFIGKSASCAMTEYSGGVGPKFDGNSILVQEDPKTYAFIGHSIFRFSADDEIVGYESPVGNNDVPYPTAIGTKFMYLMVDGTRVDKDLIATLGSGPDFAYEVRYNHGHLYDHAAQSFTAFEQTTVVERE